MSRSMRPTVLGPKPSARMRLPPAAWLNTPMLDVAGFACILPRTRSGQLLDISGNEEELRIWGRVYRSLPPVSLPLPSVIESPRIPKALDDGEDQASTALIKNLCMSIYHTSRLTYYTPMRRALDRGVCNRYVCCIYFVTKAVPSIGTASGMRGDVVGRLSLRKIHRYCQLG